MLKSGVKDIVYFLFMNKDKTKEMFKGNVNIALDRGHLQLSNSLINKYKDVS